MRCTETLLTRMSSAPSGVRDQLGTFGGWRVPLVEQFIRKTIFVFTHCLVELDGMCEYEWRQKSPVGKMRWKSVCLSGSTKTTQSAQISAFQGQSSANVFVHRANTQNVSRNKKLSPKFCWLFMFISHHAGRKLSFLLLLSCTPCWTLIPGFFFLSVSCGCSRPPWSPPSGPVWPLRVTSLRDEDAGVSLHGQQRWLWSPLEVGV